MPAVQGQVPVTQEDIRHMKNRVYQFTARHQMDMTQLVDVPKCRESFCKVVVEDSTAFALRAVPRGPAPVPRPSAGAAEAGGAEQAAGNAVQGFDVLMRNAQIPHAAAQRLLQDGISR